MNSTSVSTFADSEFQYDYSSRIAILFVVFVLLYETSTYIANDMIMPGMLAVVHSFNASEQMVSTSLTAYILGGACLQIFLGPISDRYGRRPVMLFGAGFFLLCSICIALSQSMEQFILARFFQGMGLCFISVIGYATLQEIFSELQAVRLVSMMNNISILAPLAGPLLGSLVIIHFSWRAVFVVISLLALIALVGLWSVMPETVGIQKRDGSIAAHTPIKLSTVTRNYFYLFQNYRFMCGSIALGFSMIPIIAWIGTSPIILMEDAHFTVMQYALLQMPIFFGTTLGNIVMRYFTYRSTLKKIMHSGSCIILVSLLCCAIFSYFNANYFVLIIGLSIYAFGLGFVSAPLNRIILYSTAVPKGTASALMSLLMMIIMALGNQLGGIVYYNHQNFYFALFCATCGIAYAGFYLATHKLQKSL